MSTISDKIREAVADWIGGSDVEFSTKDIMDAIESILGLHSDSSSLVSSAMRAWCDQGRIVKGYRAEITTKPGSNRRYRLLAVNGNRKPVLEDGSADAKSKRPKSRTSPDQIGQTISVRIMEAKPDGSMLVRMEDRTYVMRKLDW